MASFCYCGDVNDHEAYPRALASAPPTGWIYRPTKVEFDRDLGRPWGRFQTMPGELIHSSSLIPTNESPWILETDHIGFVVMQAQMSAGILGRVVDIHEIEQRIVEAVTGKWCLGALVWSKASKSALEGLCERHGVAPVPITHAYPAVVPPKSGSCPQAGELLTTIGKFDKLAFRLLHIDSQNHRGASKVAGRKNVAAAVECAKRLRRTGARVELVIVGPTEAIDVDEDWLHVLPVLHRSDLWHLYRVVDLLLFLSRQETFGYVTMEAMRSGVCCLAANGRSLPAITEIIEHRRTGILVDFFEQRPYPELSGALDIDLAVAEIATLIAAPEARRQLVRNAHLLFEADGAFSVETRNQILVRSLFG